MADGPDTEEVVAEARAFLQGFRTLVLASSNAAGEPEPSYAPFVRLDDNAFYVYVSELARHTGNLLETGRAGVLLLEDEGAAAQLFARRRLTFRCTACAIERGSDRWSEILDVFEGKFGPVIGVLRPLTDFVLFRLAPSEGSYVRGFAQAYRFSGPELSALRLVNDVAHRPEGAPDP